MGNRAKSPKAESKPRRLFPESVPPAMVAEVFDVAGADDDVLLSSVPPPPERPSARPSRSWSKPPVPHPPHRHRPSVAPGPADALELPSDTLEPVEPGPSSSSELRGALLTPPPTETPVRTPPASAGRGAFWAIGAVALVLGVALGIHARTPARAQQTPHAPSHAVVRLHTTSADSATASSPNGASPVAEPAHATPAEPAPETTVEEGAAFDAQAARAAINGAFQRAAVCRGPNDESGAATAVITYAPSGRVTSATVSGVFAGTAIGTCIADALRGASVPPFSGEGVTVRHTVELR